MSTKPFTVTRLQARELRRIAETTARDGGVPHDEVVRLLNERTAQELRQMVKEYRHPGPGLNEILEVAAFAHADGLDISESLEQLLAKIADGASV